MEFVKSYLLFFIMWFEKKEISLLHSLALIRFVIFFTGFCIIYDYFYTLLARLPILG